MSTIECNGVIWRTLCGIFNMTRDRFYYRSYWVNNKVIDVLYILDIDWLIFQDIDFSEAIVNKKVKKDLLKKMNLKIYPPRFCCEVADLTKGKGFFLDQNVYESH